VAYQLNIILILNFHSLVVELIKKVFKIVLELKSYLYIYHGPGGSHRKQKNADQQPFSSNSFDLRLDGVGGKSSLAIDIIYTK